LPLIRDDYDEIEEQEETFNVPFNLYVEGSYFGDSDCILEKDGIREWIASAETDCHLLVL
jgi:hypothetical protein